MVYIKVLLMCLGEVLKVFLPAVNEQPDGGVNLGD